LQGSSPNSMSHFAAAGAVETAAGTPVEFVVEKGGVAEAMFDAVEEKAGVVGERVETAEAKTGVAEAAAGNPDVADKFVDHPKNIENLVM